MSVHTLVPALLVVVFAVLGCGRGTDTSTADELSATTWDEALALSRKHHKPILIDFFTDWCSSCKTFARAAKENEQLRTGLAHVILLKNDCEKGAGVDLAKQYEVRVYPTFAMVNEAGEVTDRWAGYPGAEEFVALIAAGRADPRTIDEKEQAYTAAPTLALSTSLARYSEAVFANVAAVTYYRKAIELDPARTPEFQHNIFMAMYYGLRSGAFAPVDLLAEGRALVSAPDAGPETVVMVASIAQRVASPEDYLPFLKQALLATEGAEGDLADARRNLEVDTALLIEGDVDKALALKKAAMPEGWLDQPAALNSFAWWCFEHDVNLDDAFVQAMRGAQLATSDGDKANILDTAAEIAFKQGQVDRAIKLETEAVSLAPDRGAFKRTLEKFKGGVEG